MALPFLMEKKIKSPDVLIAERKSDKPDDDSPTSMLHSAASDLIDAVHARDIAKVAEALHAAFQISDELPHEEAPHEEGLE
jgi:hypothetical protein